MKESFTARNGRVFTFVGLEPYTRTDGSATQLRVWQSLCAHPGCAGVFRVKTPLNSGTKAFGRKHCEDHKMSREEAIRCWQETLRRNRQERYGQTIVGTDDGSLVAR